MGVGNGNSRTSGKNINWSITLGYIWQYLRKLYTPRPIHLVWGYECQNSQAGSWEQRMALEAT